MWIDGGWGLVEFDCCKLVFAAVGEQDYELAGGVEAVGGTGGDLSVQFDETLVFVAVGGERPYVKGRGVFEEGEGFDGFAHREGGVVQMVHPGEHDAGGSG